MFSDISISLSLHRHDSQLSASTPIFPSSSFDFDEGDVWRRERSHSAPLMGERLTIEGENDLLFALGRLVRRPDESDEERCANQKYGHILAKMRVGVRLNCSEEVESFLKSCIESTQPYREPKSFASEEEKSLYFLNKTLFCIYNPESFSHLSQRDRYRETIRNFRKALQSDYYMSHPSSVISTLLNKIAFSIFTEVEVQSFTQSVVEQISSAETSRSSSPSHSSSSLSFHSSSSSSCSEEDDLSSETIDQFMKVVTPDYLRAFHASVPNKEGFGQKMRGEFRLLGFDPILQGNPPNVKFRLVNKENILITSVRTPTPTDEDGNITLEFKAFLRYLKANGKKYVMINLQNRTNASLLRKMFTADGESVRSRNLEQLANEEEFKDVITVFTFDKNSEFFRQEILKRELVHSIQLIKKHYPFEERYKNHWAALLKEECEWNELAEELIAYIESNPFSTVSVADFSFMKGGRDFCQQFIRNLFDSEGFHVPESWWTDEKFAKITQRIQFVYKQFFNEKEYLSPQERQDFIEIAYLFLTDFIVQETGAEYYNTSCKDCIDRGGGANWLLMALMILLETVFQERSHPDAVHLGKRIESLPAKLEEDAIWARKRRITDERFERAQSAINRMADKIKSVPGLAEKLVEMFHFKSIYIPADESIHLEL